ncbi:hypothetical protein BWP24_18750 [Vibrio campbellii]|nr:hypothetical protein BWP24_18750 [Vibrio campbellii]ARR09592.1 unknow [Vibrio campbellii]
MKDWFNWLLLLIALVLILLLISFGVLIGSVNLGNLSVGVKWTDIVSAFGAFIGSFATVFGIVVALYVGSQWKKQNKVRDLVEYSESLLELLYFSADLESMFLDHFKKFHPKPYALEEEDVIRVTELCERLEVIQNRLLVSYARLILLYPKNETSPLIPSPVKSKLTSLRGAILSDPPNLESIDDYKKLVENKKVDFDKAIETRLEHVRRLCK